MSAAVKDGAGSKGLIIAGAVLTLLAAGGGAGVGKLIVAKLATKTAVVTDDKASAGPKPLGEETDIREIPAVVTNLADPPEARIRMQLAIVFAKKAVEKPEVLGTEIANDVVAYLKTLTVAQLQGATGLEALREDLTDRAATRSGGKIRDVMIENFVIQ